VLDEAPYTGPFHSEQLTQGVVAVLCGQESPQRNLGERKWHVGIVACCWFVPGTDQRKWVKDI